MLAVENKIEETIEEFIVREYPKLGLTGCAECFGISKATLGYWMLKLNLQTQVVVLLPGDVVEVRRLD